MTFFLNISKAYLSHKIYSSSMFQRRVKDYSKVNAKSDPLYYIDFLSFCSINFPIMYSGWGQGIDHLAEAYIVL